MVLDCAIATARYSDIAFIDKDLTHKSIAGYPVFCEREIVASGDGVSSFYENHDEVIVAIGSNELRLKISSDLTNDGIRLATLIHPSAVVSKFSTVREGTVILANAVVNPFSSIGVACIVNSGAIVEHDCVIGNGTHISPGAVLSGSVTVGDEAWICAGSSITNNVQIGAGSIVGLGAVVLSDVPRCAVVYGVPAKVQGYR